MRGAFCCFVETCLLHSWIPTTVFVFVLFCASMDILIVRDSGKVKPFYSYVKSKKKMDFCAHVGQAVRTIVLWSEPALWLRFSHVVNNTLRKKPVISHRDW